MYLQQLIKNNYVMADLKGLKYYRSGGLVFYYEEKDGEKKIRYIQVYLKKNLMKVDGDIGISEIVDENENGELDRLDEIVKFLKGLPEGSNLKQIIDSIDGLSEDEKEALNDLINGQEISEEELEQSWEEAMRQAEEEAENGTLDAGAGSGQVSDGGSSLDE